MNVIRCFTQRNALLIKMKVSNRRKRYDVLQNTASAEMEGIMDQTTRLILAAVVGMILLLVLIIKFKIHAMLSILIFFTSFTSSPCFPYPIESETEHQC